jgi:diguanylate cyclase (GGDEF)-like protein
MIFSFHNSGFRDPETGVYNQTYFMEAFNREWHRHMRENQSLALLYLCPRIHETTKHPHLLEMLAKQIQETLLRSTDLIARMDEQHFVIGLFNVAEKGAEIVLSRIDECIKNFPAQFSPNHSVRLDYKLAAVICTPNKDRKIEQLFSQTEQLSHTLESDNRRCQTLSRLQ